MRDESLINECQRLATGADIHDVNGMICCYGSAFTGRLMDQPKWQEYARCAERALKAYRSTRDVKIMRELFSTLHVEWEKKWTLSSVGSTC